MSIWDFINGVLQNLVVAAVTGLVGFFFIKKYFSQIIFSSEMRSCGFSNTSVKKQSERELNEMLKNAREIKIIFVSGVHFMKQNEAALKRALKSGVHIRFLCASPDSPFLDDIENMEQQIFTEDGEPLRSADKKISTEIFDLFNRFKDTNLEIRFYRDEYRLPFILAEYPKKGVKKAWLTVTLPPYKSAKSFVLRGSSGTCGGDDVFTQEEDINFIKMMDVHFETIWNHASETPDHVLERKHLFDGYGVCREGKYAETYSYWSQKYQTALYSRKAASENNGILIEAAAQHPLQNGVSPNEEFAKRLRLAAQLYFEEKKKGIRVCIYVPGSLHQYNGVPDKISLSKAGVRYLMELQVPEEDLYGEEMNQKYKGESGVYNSADECFVAGRIFRDEHFARLYCVCSPAQMMRKTLYYIEFGIVPDNYTVSCDDMYHSYIEEAINRIPYVLYDDHSLQAPDSKEAETIRKERMPKAEHE